MLDILNNFIHLSRSTDYGGVENADLLFRKCYIRVPVLLGHSAHLTENTCYVFQIGVVYFIEIGNSLSYTSIGNWEKALNNWDNAYENEKGWNGAMLFFSYGHEMKIRKSFLLHYKVYWQHRFTEQGFSITTQTDLSGIMTL